MHWKFIHRKRDALSGRETRYVSRHPTFEIPVGLYEALKPIAKKRGYKTVNEMIRREGTTMLMNILLEDQ